MKTNNSISVRWFTFLPLLGLAAGTGFVACAGEFKAQCPEGTVQNGGGDVDEACVAAGASGAGGQGGAGSPMGGQAGQGAGGGQAGECAAGATRCQNDEQQTCGEDGRWGAPKGCDIQCDAEGSQCVVPVQVAAGLEFTCALLSNGSVRCWGGNQRGQLGLGLLDESLDKVLPTVVPALGNVKKIVVNRNNACALVDDGTFHCWGNNEFEEVASGSGGQTPFVASPSALPGKTFADLDAGRQHTCAIEADAVWCRGSAADGMLGNGATAGQSATLVRVLNFDGVAKAISVGFRHACAVSTSGAAFCWGAGEYGQLGQLDNSTSSSGAVRVKGNAVNISSLESGHEFSCALRDDRAVVCWGNNTYGQLGRGYASPGVEVDPEGGVPKIVNGLSAVSQISTNGGDHVCAVSTDGSVWCWGENDAGSLGNDCSAAPCENDVTYLKKFSPVPMQAPVENVKQVSAGDRHSCALKNDGSIHCWGWNGRGQLGNGEVNNAGTPTPTRVVWK